MSIAVAPIVAACGVPFAKMSGRGLGHTGGTLDKLESIPGFRVELSTDEFIAQVKEVGLAIIGQTADLVPADKRLYALRDVTGDGRQHPADRRLDHVQEDRGGRRGDRARRQGRRRRVHEDASRTRARSRRRWSSSARRAGREVVCVLTDMDQPLGRAVGNALEIREAMATLRGDGPARLHRARARCVCAGCSRSPISASTRPRPARAPSGRSPTARRRAAFERWIRAQGGDPDECRLPTAPVVRTVDAPRRAGSRRLRSRSAAPRFTSAPGRAATGDTIDHAVGIVCLRKRGERVEVGEPLAEIHAVDDASAASAAAEVVAAYSVGDAEPRVTSVVLETFV